MEEDNLTDDAWLINKAYDLVYNSYKRDGLLHADSATHEFSKDVRKTLLTLAHRVSELTGEKDG